MSTAAGRPARQPVPGTELSAAERGWRLVLLLALLYAFLAGIDVLSSGISGLGSDVTESLFRSVSHPLAGLSVGILATVLAQSSSVTSATIVTLVGAGVIEVGDAVPMIMGANVGTTVTNTLASLGSLRRPEDFRRAFAGATVHDFFNFLAVVALLPVEIATGFLARSAAALSGLVGGASGGEFESPLKAAVGWAAGLVERGVASVAGEGRLAALLLILLGLAILFSTLVSITRNMRVVVAGPAERALNSVLGRSGALGIVVGAVLTVAVQSSSISTSLLIPMIAAGVLSLENAYPVTIGANIGTTVTALIAALATPQIEGLQIALVHLLFNVSAMALFYPVPALRRLPLAAARWVADQAVDRRTMVLGYLVALFFVAPLVGTVLFG